MEELRKFLSELVGVRGLREVADLVGQGHEGLRKFTNGDTETPHPDTLRRFTELYLKFNRPGRVAETHGVAPAHPSAPELKMILPPGLKPAKDAVRQIFAAARASKEPLPDCARALEKHLLSQLADEYEREPHYRVRRDP